MRKRNPTPVQIADRLREAETLLSQGKPREQVYRELGISERTYYRWRRNNRGLRPEEARRLKELERENERLRRLVAELALEKTMLQEALSETCERERVK